MRIQNNITAMNTHRQYTINNDNVAKAAEKLSSGYRINRAADDAAGLAISEKMRSQIRGLNMATKNSQDAISLVQTAEGALQETHSMLQRMNELAVQAATGTNQDFDKIQAAKEFEQLKREINDVAESTTFNNMKILDGSLSYEGFQRSASTAGVTVTATEQQSDAASGMTSAVTTKADAGGGSPAVKASFKIDLSKGTWNVANGASGILSVGGTNVTTGVNAGATLVDAADVAAAMVNNSATVTINTVGYTISNSGSVLTFTQTTAPAPADTVVDVSAITATGTTGVTGTFTVDDKTNSVVPVAATGPTAAEVSTVAVNVDSLKAGDTFTIADRTYQLLGDGETASGTNVGIAWAEDGDKDLTKLIQGINATAPTGVTVAADGTSGFKVTQTTVAEKGQAGYVSTKTTYTSAAAGTGVFSNTIEFDTTKMKDGDTFTLTIDGKDIEVVYDAKTMKTDADKSAAQYMAEAAAEAAQGEGLEVEAKGNAILFKGAKVRETDLKLQKADGSYGGAEDNDKTNAMRIQVGALENEQLAISIDSMNTKGLGLDGFNLETQNEAGMAITAVRNAVNKVSDQRATLGAMQNRLDHKIANLKVSSENLSAAESRIRDVDMASEMTNFTKNNILSQAATAMLAQANALPQNVLSLLG